jgi:ABC-2 type transport system permease protein
VIATVRGEWLKIRSTLSPKVCAFIALAFGVGFPVLIAIVARTADEDDLEGLNGAGVITAGVQPALVTLMIMVVIAIAAEYRFGMIRMSLAATPRRLRFMAAKLTVLVASAVVIGVSIAALGYVLANVLLAGTAFDGSADLGDPGVLRVLVGVPLVIGMSSALAGAIAFVVRSPAAGIAIVVAWSIVLEPILSAAPWVRQYVGPYLPFNASGRLLTTGDGGEHALGPWVGFGVGVAWTVALLALAAVLVRWRDA